MRTMKTPQKLRLYLDTTVPSYVFAFDSPERMEITRRFMKLRFSPTYEFVISEVVLDELRATEEPKKVLLMEQVSGLPVLLISLDAYHLAEAYIRNQILPAGSINDARHVAVATLNHIDAIVSWNFGHLVNIRRSKAINALNGQFGLPHIEIVTPQEVLE
jgi:predicted nucleic acid-binding protein